MRVLLAGTARSGSTWAANVLGHAAGTRMVYEPDGPTSDVLGALVAARLGEFPHLDVGERSRWYRLVWDLAFAGGWPWDRVEAARAAGRRMVRIPPALRDYAIAGLAQTTRAVRRRPDNVVVKSVNAVFSLDWVAAEYRPTVVVLRRNPLNVVSSWLVLDMGLSGYIGDDRRVREQYVQPRGLPYPNGSTSPVTRVAHNVGLLTRALKDAADRHPEWLVVSHDELCRDPQTHFRNLANAVGLPWTPSMEEYIERSDEPGFTVHSGSPRLHPNAVTATTEESRREQQATQFTRRMTPEQTDEARRVLDSFDLGEWGSPT